MECTRLICICVAIFFFNLSVNASPSYFLKNYYSRVEWVAQPATNPRPLKLPAPYVVIHHTYIPKACYTVKQCMLDMRSMQNYHISLDWGDIGYNFCVGSEGGAYEGCGWDHVGIHAGPANNHSIGICLIGDWSVDTPPEEQLQTTKSLIALGVKLGKISPDYKLIGHNHAMATDCPGKGLLAEISTWDHYYPGEPDFQALKSKRHSKN